MYINYFNNAPDDYLVGSTSEIDTLRPKSPPAKAKNQSFMRGRGGGRGGGPGRGIDMGMNMPAGQGTNITLVGHGAGGRGAMRGGMAAGGMPQRTMMGGFVPRGGYQPR